MGLRGRQITFAEHRQTGRVFRFDGLRAVLQGLFRVSVRIAGAARSQ